MLDNITILLCLIVAGIFGCLMVGIGALITLSKRNGPK